MSTDKLSPAEIERRLLTMPEWVIDKHTLYRVFLFENFIDAFGFMTRVALLAQTMDHHPRWSNSYNRVEIHLTSHDVEGISVRDFDMAERINALA